MPLDLIVRASSLTDFADCNRRFAARHAKELVMAAGYELREVSGQIGAKIGTSVHAGAAQMLQHKIDKGTLGKASDAVELGIETLRDEIAPGTSWDDTTRTTNEAERQVSRMVSVYHLIIAPKIEPVAVEQELTARFSPTLRLTGHLDVAVNDEVRDTKTGLHQRPNHPQYGAYSLLRRAHKHTVTKFWEDYVPRGSMLKPQREPKSTEYQVATCEQSAKAVLTRVDSQMQAFAKSMNPWEFLPNPASMLCSDRFCNAWGTAFCQAHKIK